MQFFYLSLCASPSPLHLAFGREELRDSEARTRGRSLPGPQKDISPRARDRGQLFRDSFVNIVPDDPEWYTRSLMCP